MHYVYILKSQKDESYYIGSSTNIENRLKEHNFGRTGYTSKKRPWLLVYQEEYPTKSEALVRERQLKRLKSHKFLTDLVNMGR